MGRPAATGREIILEIVRNMREGLEPLHYSTLPPSVYHVYLHAEDLDRLRGILPRLTEEARRALDTELESLNRASLPERIKLARRSLPKVEPPEGGWRIQILENTDDDVAPGDIIIYSELGLPAKTEFGSGSMTKRIATRRLGGETTTAISTSPAPPRTDLKAFAVIEYQDNGGRQTYHMTKDQIVVGRGGHDYWTDVKLDTLPDVSREHCRIRRNPETGNFTVEDVSQFGTAVNGKPVGRDAVAELPSRATITLAGVIDLQWEAA